MTQRPLRRLIPTLLIVILISAAAAAQENNYNQQLVEMLEAYQEILAVPLDDDVDDIPGNAWKIVSAAIKEGALRFTIDPISDNRLNGARFYAGPEKTVAHIIITHKLLDSWKTYPSMAYSILCMAMQDAAIFFIDPEAWGASLSDPMARLYMKQNQYNAQALLIRDRLLPTGFLLSSYETFLLDSKEKDNLNSVVLFLELYSMPIADKISQARQALEAGSDSEKLREFAITLGKALLKTRQEIPSESDDHLVFQSAVTIHTWLEFTPYLIARMHNKNRKENPLMFNQILDIETEYAEIRRLLEASRIGDTALMNHIRAKTHDGFEELQRPG